MKKIEKKLKKLQRENRKLDKSICKLWERVIDLRIESRGTEKTAKDAMTIASADNEVLVEITKQINTHCDQIASLKDSIRKLKK